MLKLEPLQVALYLLFLKHPDGIKLTAIRTGEKKEELSAIYREINQFSDHKKAEEVLGKFFAEEKTSKPSDFSRKIAEQKSRINKEIETKIRQNKEYYQILGEKNTPYKIQLLDLYPEFYDNKVQ